MRFRRRSRLVGSLLGMLALAQALGIREAPAQETAVPEDALQEGALEEAITDPGLEPGAARQMAVLQGLDKITARISTFEAPLDAAVTFGSLLIRVRACHKRPPEETPESAAFLEVIDDRPDSDPIPVFSGWMFASSPALSALEHAVYDVWVLDCKTVGADALDPAGIEASDDAAAPDSAAGSE